MAREKSEKKRGRKSREERKSAADAAADRLRRRILEGELPAGSMLPGERELSEQLGVSRLTLRSALASLQAQGLIEKVHGAGNRVLDYRETGGVELVAHLARLAVEGGTMPLRLLGELLEFRRLIAVELLGLVAERATPEELRALREHRQAQAELVDDPEGFMKADLDFARLLVRAGHNLTLELLYNTVQRLVTATPGIEAAFAVNSRATLQTYDQLLDLIESRDPDRVRRLARTVMEPLDRRTLDRLAEAASLFAGGEGGAKTEIEPATKAAAPGSPKGEN
ncbi:MAG TPA: FCD domain-containing protein [Polyangiaceae bacterium LLY-WYZ-15_(1-7)]|nr:FCD domain-containing protein [Polyangiaceae bacterium LLY-WYZ-15_(1-7)]HJL12228.1 FCD domain-containing protein [Polyangiaceae bacterium LLY-WYZ-15_(1-7)]HJL21200.1 FCD domain-containing protein [Polyangiaceae bacterium LLY-WYZ-15_(1-7)]HJL48770.1 FCD domain-containing protein [Polyangiaceae bacterium LLY-WYZ-15_(1-7)]